MSKLTRHVGSRGAVTSVVAIALVFVLAGGMFWGATTSGQQQIHQEPSLTTPGRIASILLLSAWFAAAFAAITNSGKSQRSGSLKFLGTLIAIWLLLFAYGIQALNSFAAIAMNLITLCLVYCSLTEVFQLKRKLSIATWSAITLTSLGAVVSMLYPSMLVGIGNRFAEYGLLYAAVSIFAALLAPTLFCLTLGVVISKSLSCNLLRSLSLVSAAVYTLLFGLALYLVS